MRARRTKRCLAVAESRMDHCWLDDVVYEVAKHVVLRGRIYFREEIQKTGRHSEDMRLFTATQKNMVMGMMVECRAREAERIEEVVA